VRERRADLARLLSWYPEPWRRRYGDELAVLMEDQLGGRTPSARFRVSVALAGLRERGHESGIVGRGSAPIERVRAGTLLVLCAWTGFAVAGASFSKLSEHFAAALPKSLRGLPQTAFEQVEIVAVVAAVLLVIGGLTALPAFARFVRAGGWGVLRRPLLRAAALSAVAAVSVLPLSGWAHSLSVAQRNGSDAAYSLAIGFWALLVVAALGQWTHAAVVAARRLDLSRRVLAVESALAVAVAASMIAMTVCTAIWWGAVALHAPWFLHGTRAGSGGSPFNLQLVVTMALMALAVALGEYGVVRIGRSWLELRRAAA
jgi:hypothetical protein